MLGRDAESPGVRSCSFCYARTYLFRCPEKQHKAIYLLSSPVTHPIINVPLLAIFFYSFIIVKLTTSHRGGKDRQDCVEQKRRNDNTIKTGALCQLKTRVRNVHRENKKNTQFQSSHRRTGFTTGPAEVNRFGRRRKYGGIPVDPLVNPT